MEILRVNNLTKIYNAYKGAKEVKALDGISLECIRFAGHV
ncbi:hypothetical protein SAMN03080606_01901 [Alkaliphilus peptidifermentans DSM 18978]|uniref:Uncharacterized protein n=1 Tax=Alkaliphilus peptidifermentans DSM 18978 TaxID=1120976 RepID=A0A1G5H8S8_9FIRM|nr:hypothetical protein SAMN03080606_01901 [Alkaliphilus peptidifermentans DSM 18978]